MNRVREFREARGLSRQELADRCGLSHSAIAFIETGYTKRTYPRNMAKIAVALGQGVAEVFPGISRSESILAKSPEEILAESDRLAPGRCRWCGRRNVKAQMIMVVAAGEEPREFGHLRCAAEYIFDNTDRQGNWKKRRNEGI